jgi:YD repeat-containing protein
MLSGVSVRAATVTYAYDSRGRVVSVTYASGLTTFYVYDATGNRTQVTTTAPPVAAPVALTVAADSSGNTVVLSVAGSFTSVAVQTSPGHGSASASGTSISYSPTSGYSGADSFTYTASNSSGTSAPATVQVAVAPSAQATPVTVAYGSSGNPVTPIVLGSYSTAGLSSFPSNGVATPSGNEIKYTPASNFFGTDSFYYVAANAVATSAPALLTVTVNPQPPIANPIRATVIHDTTANNIPLTITGGAPASVAVSTAASHGTALATSTTIAYTPAHGYSGSDSFDYTATNAGGTSTPALATLTVLPALPIANPFDVMVTISSINNSMPLNITGGTASSVAAGTPLHGTATASGTNITYTPITGYSGSDNFWYTATNAAGTSAPATISITVASATLFASTTAGSWSFTVPSGSMSHAIITCLGGGGGGGTTSGKGGGGGTAEIDVAVTAGTTVFSGSIGATGTSTGTMSGSAGGATTCNSTTSSPSVSITAGGGFGAFHGTDGAGGTAMGGTTNITGGTGTGAAPGSVTITQNPS